METKELRILSRAPGIVTREKGSESRTVEGYALVFNELSQPLGGWFREKINPDALEGADIEDVVALFNHNNNYLLARTISKTLSLSVDDSGLRYEFEAPNTTAGNDLLESLRRGDIQHSSFAFEIASGGDTWEKDETGGEIRTITKFKRIYDVSPVVNPAYLQTSVDLAKRSHDQHYKKTEIIRDTDIEIDIELI